MREVKHVLLDERLLDFFVGPVYEQFVVEIGFLGEAAREVDGILEACSSPIGLEEDAKLLCTS